MIRKVDEEGRVWVRMPAGTPNRIHWVEATELGRRRDWLTPFREDVCVSGY